MTATPKTIQIFLPGGDPRGIRVAEITTRIVQGFATGGRLPMAQQSVVCRISHE
jgi:hypothetical protein